MGGQCRPTMCSLRFSPLPTPRKKRPGIIAPAVAAAWATMAGCTRMIGQVTPVPSMMRAVLRATAPTTAQTNGLCPCWSVQGWKWSDTMQKSKPACSARTACSTSASGFCSSLDSV